jgi:hypothetical protein
MEALKMSIKEAAAAAAATIEAAAAAATAAANRSLNLFTKLIYETKFLKAGFMLDTAPQIKIENDLISIVFCHDTDLNQSYCIHSQPGSKYIRLDTVDHVLNKIVYRQFFTVKHIEGEACIDYAGATDLIL